MDAILWKHYNLYTLQVKTSENSPLTDNGKHPFIPLTAALQLLWTRNHRGPDVVAGLGRDLSLGGAVSLGLTLREERQSLLGTSTVPRAGQGRRLQVSLAEGSRSLEVAVVLWEMER